jgi:hypothetical protein
VLLDEESWTLEKPEGCYCIKILRRDLTDYTQLWLPSTGLVLRPVNLTDAKFVRMGVFCVGPTFSGGRRGRWAYTHHLN